MPDEYSGGIRTSHSNCNSFCLVIQVTGCLALSWWKVMCFPLTNSRPFFEYFFQLASLVAQTIKRLTAMQETQVRSLGWEDPLEKEMAAHSSILAWKISWIAELGRLPSMGSQRVRHDWPTSLSLSVGLFGFPEEADNRGLPSNPIIYIPSPSLDEDWPWLWLVVVHFACPWSFPFHIIVQHPLYITCHNLI